MRRPAPHRPSKRLGFRGSPARAELSALYAEVDALLAPFSCEASAECCHFGVTGREPYPTAVEVAEVELALAALGGPPTAASPLRKKLPLADTAGRCPVLSADGRCRIYASRPFGCRTFFCDRATGPGKMPRQEVLRISRAIADLSARFSPKDALPRPLTRALRPGSGRENGTT